MDKFAVIVAGGTGSRLGTVLPKQFLTLNNKPVLWYTITAFLDAYSDTSIILVLPESHLETGRALVNSFNNPGITITSGGNTRYESVQNGLQLVPPSSIVFVHDGVRCLVSPALIRKCHYAASVNGNAIPAIAATDTIRIETPSGNEMIDRNLVRLIQTPQTFLSDTIKKAFAGGYDDSFTDEASVVETAGEKIHLVEGEITNIKITRPIDLLIAEKILEDRNSGL